MQTRVMVLHLELQLLRVWMVMLLRKLARMMLLLLLLRERRRRGRMHLLVLKKLLQRVMRWETGSTHWTSRWNASRSLLETVRAHSTRPEGPRASIHIEWRRRDGAEGWRRWTTLEVVRWAWRYHARSHPRVKRMPHWHHRQWSRRRHLH